MAATRRATDPETPEDVQRQVDRFRETARELGCDEDPAAFDAVLRGLAKAPPVHKPAPARARKPRTPKP